MWFVAAFVGLISAIQTFSSMEASRRNAEYQAKVAEANSSAMRAQADITRKQTEIAQQAKSDEQLKLKHEYNEAAGTNTSLLAAGNVDTTSGSALDLLEGNANRFADDMGKMEFDKAMIGWTGRRQEQLQKWQADVYSSQASYLKSTAGSTFGSLLSAGLSGTVSGLSAYGSMGGFKDFMNLGSGTFTKQAVDSAGNPTGPITKF